MPQQQYIRFLRESEGLSVNEIAGRVGIHLRTAKKYAVQSNWNKSVAKKKSSPGMGPFMEIVDTWLEEDRLLPRKQRHTGVRIFQRLRDEHQWVSQGYKLLTYKLLVVSLPYSNAAFVYSTPAENQECFLEALKQCFEKMAADLVRQPVYCRRSHRKNRASGNWWMVSSVSAPTTALKLFFCNPYSGHEKGHLENKCGYSKRNWAVPIPVYESHEQLAATLAEQAMQDRN